MHVFLVKYYSSWLQVSSLLSLLDGYLIIRVRSNWLFAVAVTQPWSCTVFHYVRLFLSGYVMCCFIGKV